MEDSTALMRWKRPKSSQELEALIRELLTADVISSEELEVDGLDDVTITAVLRGPDIHSIDVDASGLDIRFKPTTPAPPEAIDGDAQQPAESDDSPEPAVVSRESAVLRRAAVKALPITIQGAPVEFEAEAHNVAFEWLELADGTTVVKPVESNGSWRRSPRVDAAVRMRRDDILTLLLVPFRAEAEREGVVFSREKLSLSQVGPRRVKIGVRMRVRWKFLAATFRLRTEIHVDSKFQLRLGKPRISSSNPLVSVLLLVFRGQVNEATRELMIPFDLNEGLSPFRLKTLRIRAGARVEIRAELVA